MCCEPLGLKLRHLIEINLGLWARREVIPVNGDCAECGNRAGYSSELKLKSMLVQAWNLYIYIYTYIHVYSLLPIYLFLPTALPVMPLAKRPPAQIAPRLPQPRPTAAPVPQRAATRHQEQLGA